MFAGKMKLTTLLTALVVGGVCGVAGFAFATCTMAPEAVLTKAVSKGKPFKVNVYQDAGAPTANRVEVDLDREWDEKWDEKFTFEDGTITRKVAPADDEVYTQSYRWDGKEWVAERIVGG